MAKKGENIRKRKDGRWEARYQKGRKADGSIEYGYIYAKRYTDVKQKRNEAIKSLKEEPTPPPEDEKPDIVLNKLFDQWKTDVRSNIKDSSFCLYETMLNHHLRPYFGKLQLNQLTTTVIQEFINNKIKEDLSPTYIRSIMILFQTILKAAQSKYQWRVPLLPAPQLPKQTKRMPEIFTLQELKCLEEHLKRQDDEFSFGILICMYMGLRIGELSGLRWEDFDPASVQFKIRRTVYRIKNSAYVPDDVSSKTILCIGSPKTPTSIRDIPLPLGLLDALQKHQKNPETFILTGTVQCMEPRNIQKKYKRLLQQLGLRYLNFHALRHNFATLSIQNGSDYRTVAELLGHSSVNTTLNIYVHSDIDQKRKCLELLVDNTDKKK